MSHEADSVLPQGIAGERVMVVHAHPDDEVFTTGAATLALSRAGAQVELLIATGGELPEIGAKPGIDEATARRFRERRLEQSCRLLGIDSWSYLTGPGQWVDCLDVHRTLAAAQAEIVASAVRTVIDARSPSIVLTVGPDGLTGHPDHIAIHNAVVAALRLPGWSPRHALGAVVGEAVVRRADAMIQELSRGNDGDGHHDDGARQQVVRGVPAAVETRAIRCEGAESARRAAMDLYQDGLGSDPVESLVGRHGVGGASLTLRAVFDLASWEIDRFVDLG